jgi:hypothetical protein
MTTQVKLPLDWTKGMSDLEKEEFVAVLGKSVWLARRIRELLKERLEFLERKENSEKAYDNPSWAFYQADIIGAKREVKYLLSLFDPMKEKND